MTDLLYAGVSPDPRLSCFRIDRQTGGLDLAGDTALPGNPGAITASPDRRFLYADVTVGEVHQAHSFRIDADSGALLHIGTSEFGPYPCHIATDRRGRFLLAAYYGDGMVTVHAIGPDGAVGGRLQLVKTALRAHYVTTDAANRYAFVPHVCDANAIYQFRFDPQTGQLAPNDPPRASPPTPEGPRHMCFHPNGRFAFSNGEQGSSVTSWAYDGAGGTLRPLQTLSALPAGWQGSNSESQIHLTPDGRFLYSCNRGHDSLAGFRVDGATGALTSLGQFAAEKTPRPTAVSPDGAFLFNAGDASTRIVGYRIAAAGALERLRAFQVGSVSWLCALRLP